ncbi:MAG TPA: accessory factor UbiK family protein [Rhodocyclaceae bacterium]|nr:accessory factor UbiK family protein [Rhodocyclaceae bacterium]
MQINSKLFEDFNAKLSELIANSPAKDIEKNIKALAAGAFSKLELVTREEFEVQREVLVRTRERLAQLEAQVAALEARIGGTEMTRQ